MSIYCPYINGNVVYLQCKECDARICEKDWFFCGVTATQQAMGKHRKQVAEYLDKMLAKRDKVVIVAESGQKIAALAAMYASRRQQRRELSPKESSWSRRRSERREP